MTEIQKFYCEAHINALYFKSPYVPISYLGQEDLEYVPDSKGHKAGHTNTNLRGNLQMTADLTACHWPGRNRNYQEVTYATQEEHRKSTKRAGRIQTQNPRQQ